MILFVFFLIDASLISLLAVWMAKAANEGSLERNQLIGIRTKATFASDEVWDVAHKAAIHYSIPTVALALQVVILIWGSVIGHRRAKDVAS
ncbi:SdpI family protein [Arthrobacter sp. HMSC08H08]|uniref:SdpI family protein n=1 Tax=Arthrobacter sp. HMSC08H08 TaxID=1581143 RepID=UPI0008A2718C|nr:SdpI family protein [Arthrobacter sp. HMSC08H08]OFT23957.1 hypothetical protein HMPREF3175_02715 [Arthrobacter sp. HMSC08H08]